MSPAEFRRLVEEAIDSLPEDILRHLKNVQVLVEWTASPEQRRKMGLRPWEDLFGLYEGVPLTERNVTSGEPLFPDRITIFQRPIERRYRTPERIREAIRRTLIHEIAHHFGISDERLREIGAY
jgi:predicted Zn-dependent protease with MMP-like domain